MRPCRQCIIMHACKLCMRNCIYRLWVHGCRMAMHHVKRGPFWDYIIIMRNVCSSLVLKIRNVSSINPFSQQKFLSIRIALANFEYSSMRTLISGAHGNQHSPELTTPTQWKDSALARSQNSPQNASASCYMHIAAFTYHPTTTHCASKLTLK